MQIPNSQNWNGVRMKLKNIHSSMRAEWIK